MSRQLLCASLCAGLFAVAPLLRATEPATPAEPSRPRLAILTDIGGDPDDEQSMIRLMTYANAFDIEILMATAVRETHAKNGPTTRPDLIRRIVAAYRRVSPNLRRHADDWPDADQLLAAVVAGNPRYGREFIGGEHDSDGSRALIARIDAGTPGRPLNIAIWGGQTDLAQALWRVRHDRGADGLARFVDRFRVYDVADQDAIADWMRAEFPGMFYILAAAPEGRDKRASTYRGMYLTGDLSLTSREWIDAHVRNMGPLGELYPTRTHTSPNPHRCMKEGDTPSWFFFLPHGGNDPDNPAKPGWGGQFQMSADGWYRDLPITGDFDPRTTVSRWRPDFQKDFAKRMTWCLPRAENRIPEPQSP